VWRKLHVRAEPVHERMVLATRLLKNLHDFACQLGAIL
jgi:hypothetical protein